MVNTFKTVDFWLKSLGGHQYTCNILCVTVNNVDTLGDTGRFVVQANSHISYSALIAYKFNRNLLKIKLSLEEPTKTQSRGIALLFL